MEGGVIAKWHKKPGNSIKEGDLLLEVSTDKATVEYNALDEGILRKILVAEGTEAKVNQPIAVASQSADESIDGYEPQWSGEGPPKEAKNPEATSTQKPPSQASVAKQPAPPKKTPAPQPTSPLPKPPQATGRAEQKRAVSFAATGPVRASPYAKKLAETHRLDLSSVNGTGPGGRIVSRDLEHAQPLSLVAFGRKDQPVLPIGSYDLEAATPMRRVIGERLLAAKTTIPHFYVSVVCNAEPLVTLRQQLKEWGLNATFNDLILRATSLALRQHPDVNSGFDPEGPSLIRYQTIDISIAVAVPGGLITPIVRYADTKHLGALSSEVKELAQRAKEGALAPEEFQGGSFTISNLGMFGVEAFFPIINPPQAAILGVGGILDAAVVKGESVVAGKQITLSLAADHRVIDGAEAARFLNTLRTLIESPAGLVVG
jgi:pyruvate dehydrogenase E2 component (dihydrolipoamide acetyltransferase)